MITPDDGGPIDRARSAAASGSPSSVSPPSRLYGVSDGQGRLSLAGLFVVRTLSLQEGRVVLETRQLAEETLKELRDGETHRVLRIIVVVRSHLVDVRPVGFSHRRREILERGDSDFQVARGQHGLAYK